MTSSEDSYVRKLRVIYVFISIQFVCSEINIYNENKVCTDRLMILLKEDCRKTKTKNNNNNKKKKNKKKTGAHCRKKRTFQTATKQPASGFNLQHHVQKTYLSRLITKPTKMACAPSEDSDQTGHPPSLMSA